MAEFKAAAVFSDNMVLQQGKNIRVFGEGENGEEVIVTFCGQTTKTIVQQNKWMAILPPLKAGNGYEMKLFCKEEEIRFQNIAIGEVWLAGGQSNMEFELQNCTGGQDMMKNDSSPNVRFYYTQKKAYMDNSFIETEKATGWEEFGSKGTGCWSAVGYIFAKELAARLGVTVGIIGCNWGGTSASCWVDKDSLERDKDLSTYLSEYETAILGKSEEQQIAEYTEYEEFRKIWEPKCNKLYEERPDIGWDEINEILGDSRYPGPLNCANPYRPTGLYNTMIKRIAPYTLKGVIYYQGESDDHKPRFYEKLLTNLISCWRTTFKDLELPFLFVQLPIHRYKQDPDFKNWCLIREAQMNIYKTIKNTGIAVALDCGVYNDIHPKNKQLIGERLALQAFCQVYKTKTDEDVFGPIYKKCIYENARILLCFDYAKDGFIIEDALEGFEIAGQDKIFVKANAKITGEQIAVWGDGLMYPKYVRYFWTNYAKVGIFGRNHMPLAPFRTDWEDELNVRDANEQDEIRF